MYFTNWLWTYSERVCVFFVIRDKAELRLLNIIFQINQIYFFLLFLHDQISTFEIYDMFARSNEQGRVRLHILGPVTTSHNPQRVSNPWHVPGIWSRIWASQKKKKKRQHNPRTIENHHICTKTKQSFIYLTFLYVIGNPGVATKWHLCSSVKLRNVKNFEMLKGEKAQFQVLIAAVV